MDANEVVVEFESAVGPRMLVSGDGTFDDGSDVPEGWIPGS